MMQHKIITRLSDILQQPLPGWDVQKTMSPRPSIAYKKHPIDAKLSAVLILMSHNHNNELQVTYIKRASHPQDPHGGQIGFPGGRKEEKDKTLLDTAKRECSEELGIAKSNYMVLGHLSHIYVDVSNFYLQPYVAYSESTLHYILQESEVAEVIEVKLNDLIHDDIRKTKDYKNRSSIINDMPYYDLNPHILWGASAMITAELLYLIKSI